MNLFLEYPMICCGVDDICNHNSSKYLNKIIECENGGVDLKLFNKYLSKSKYYFEFGSGGSTHFALKSKGILRVYSVENDREWFINVNNFNKKFDNFKYFYVDTDAGNNTCGEPTKNADIEKFKNYYEAIHKLTDSEIKNLDFILIDGRFRVMCCLYIFDLIDDNCIICFDDFKSRKYYHEVLNYYDIIDKNWTSTDSRLGQLIIMKKKKNVKIPQSILEKYKYDFN
jgi:hypothetical protein